VTYTELHRYSAGEAFGPIARSRLDLVFDHPKGFEKGCPLDGSKHRSLNGQGKSSIKI